MILLLWVSGSIVHEVNGLIMHGVDVVLHVVHAASWIISDEG